MTIGRGSSSLLVLHWGSLADCVGLEVHSILMKVSFFQLGILGGLLAFTGCFWSAQTGSTDLMTLHQQARAKSMGLPLLSIAVDVSSGFTIDGGLIRILERSDIHHISIDVLTKDLTDNWTSVKFFTVSRSKLADPIVVDGLNSGVPYRLKAVLFSRESNDASGVLGDVDGQTVDLPPLTYDRQVLVSWTVPMPGGDIATPSIEFSR